MRGEGESVRRAVSLSGGLGSLGACSVQRLASPRASATPGAPEAPASTVAGSALAAPSAE